MKQIIYLLATFLLLNSNNAQTTDCGTNDPAPLIILGKQLFSFDIDTEKNKIELTSNQLETGIYFYSLWLNDELKAVNKMVRTK